MSEDGSIGFPGRSIAADCCTATPSSYATLAALHDAPYIPFFKPSIEPFAEKYSHRKVRREGSFVVIAEGFTGVVENALRCVLSGLEERRARHRKQTES